MSDMTNKKSFLGLPNESALGNNIDYFFIHLQNQFLISWFVKSRMIYDIRGVIIQSFRAMINRLYVHPIDLFIPSLP